MRTAFVGLWVWKRWGWGDKVKRGKQDFITSCSPPSVTHTWTNHLHYHGWLVVLSPAMTTLSIRRSAIIMNVCTLSERLSVNTPATWPSLRKHTQTASWIINAIAFAGICMASKTGCAHTLSYSWSEGQWSSGKTNIISGSWHKLCCYGLANIWRRSQLEREPLSSAVNHIAFQCLEVDVREQEQ